MVVGQATIADLYHPDERGKAYGIFYAVLSCAGFCAPAWGGQLSQHYGWKFTFLFIAIMSFLLLLLYVLIIPETQQYKVICTYRNERQIALLETDQIAKPTWTNPCLPLLHSRD